MTKRTLNDLKQTLKLEATIHRDETDHLVVLGRLGMSWHCLGCLQENNTVRLEHSIHSSL